MLAKRNANENLEESSNFKKVKLENDEEISLIRLRCFTDQLDQHESFGKRMEKVVIERKLRRERGELLLSLFRAQSWLADSAMARRPETNRERAVAWESIASKVNEVYSTKLEYLSTEKVKKLVAYYKKKDDGSYENIKNLPIAENQLDEIIDEEVSKKRERSESLSSDVLGAAGDLEEGLEDLAFLDLIKSSSVSEHDNSSLYEKYQLKKDRHDFIVNQAEHYIDRMCFDNSSRSAAVNAERHNLWIKITQKVNEKYGEELGVLGVEQSKKVYSNFKRRKRVREGVLPRIRPESAISLPTVKDENSSSPALKSDEGLNSDELEALNAIEFEVKKENEIVRMEKILLEKDEQIATLQRTIQEQADVYTQRMAAMLEVVRLTVEKPSNFSQLFS